MCLILTPNSLHFKTAHPTSRVFSFVSYPAPPRWLTHSFRLIPPSFLPPLFKISELLPHPQGCAGSLFTKTLFDPKLHSPRSPLTLHKEGDPTTRRSPFPFYQSIWSLLGQPALPGPSHGCHLGGQDDYFTTSYSDGSSAPFRGYGSLLFSFVPGSLPLPFCTHFTLCLYLPATTLRTLAFIAPAHTHLVPAYTIFPPLDRDLL